MARDNSPKVRNKRQLERKRATRASYDRILIVSEGSKTEPNYFKEIRSAYRLQTANIEVRSSELGTAPIQVVQYAHSLFENGDPHKRLQKRAFEYVYAVFDRDAHDSYNQALSLANALNGKLKNDNNQLITFTAIPSIPCFELWLLLHYQEIKSPLHRKDVILRLKKYLPTYEKGTSSAFANTKQNLELAISRAQMLASKFTAYSYPEPFTDIHVLVQQLMTLGK
ncbi:RloB family protein [Advenella sp. EE-W14]|uniref:RloB family protein n=1 Tax=Advenella sp. EE-W14 TaxID=2722705 RepID=UPI00145F914C|nr:RloB family protein [Advenella sp. EE-W14]